MEAIVFAIYLMAVPMNNGEIFYRTVSFEETTLGECLEAAKHANWPIRYGEEKTNISILCGPVDPGTQS